MKTFLKTISDLISHDIGKIWEQQGSEDGMYGLYEIGQLNVLQTGEGVIERITREIVPGFENFILRIYVISAGSGGVCILGHKGYYDNIEYSIINLGEDDGWFFTPRNKEGYQYLYTMKKLDFIYMTSRAISLLNNIKE